MKLLFFDTETNGLPKNYNAPLKDVDNYPRMVQLAYVITNEYGEKIAERMQVVKPDGWDIPEKLQELHRVTMRRASEGMREAYVLKQFQIVGSMCDKLIAHNYDFDISIVGSNSIRAGIKHEIAKVPHLCTMKHQMIGQYVGIPGNKYYGGFKWPTLNELHIKLFGEGFKDAHDALVDVNTTVKCYFELKRLKII